MGALEDLTLRIRDGVALIDVSGAFQDPEEDRLTYRASSSVKAAVVFISGSMVTVRPLTAGVATVTVAATDRGGSNKEATQQFRVTVRDNEVIPPPPPLLSPGGGGFGFGGGGGGGSRTTAPSAPRNLTAVGGDRQVVLTWEPPLRDGGADITDYEYRIDRSPPWISTGSSDTTHTVSGLVNGATYLFEVRAVNRAGKSFASNRVEATPVEPEPQVFSLDFPHFANGGGITSDVVLVNVGTTPIRPVLYFSDRQGKPIEAAAVEDVTDGLQVRDDGGGLTVRTAIAPLGELMLSTHGRGEEVSGSVQVMAEGVIGGVLRYSVPMVGVTGVGTGRPVRDALFPARRQAGGIRTAAALHNVGREAIEVRCWLMSGGAVL